jgi:predicted kinase
MAAEPLLIIIQGAPGTGKSTLAHRLQKDLGIGLVAKDELKEYVFDTVGSSGREWSKRLGQLVIPFCYQLTKTVLEDGTSVILESAFYTQYAQAEMSDMLQGVSCRAVELYCHVDERVRQERFKDRTNSGERHPGHADSAETAMLLPTSNYGPLDVCERIDVDTSEFGNAEYDRLLHLISIKLPK